MNREQKREFLQAALRGDRDTVLRLRKIQSEAVRGKTIFAEQNSDGTITIIAPCMRWTGDKVRTMNRDEYELLVAKYGFHPLEIIN